jgi:hypothetical protein
MRKNKNRMETILSRQPTACDYLLKTIGQPCDFQSLVPFKTKRDLSAITGTPYEQPPTKKRKPSPKASKTRKNTPQDKTITKEPFQTQNSALIHLLDISLIAEQVCAYLPTIHHLKSLRHSCKHLRDALYLPWFRAEGMPLENVPRDVLPSIEYALVTFSSSPSYAAQDKMKPLSYLWEDVPNKRKPTFRSVVCKALKSCDNLRRVSAEIDGNDPFALTHIKNPEKIETLSLKIKAKGNPYRIGTVGIQLNAFSSLKRLSIRLGLVILVINQLPSSVETFYAGRWIDRYGKVKGDHKDEDTCKPARINVNFHSPDSQLRSIDLNGIDMTFTRSCEHDFCNLVERTGRNFSLTFLNDQQQMLPLNDASLGLRPVNRMKKATIRCLPVTSRVINTVYLNAEKVKVVGDTRSVVFVGVESPSVKKIRFVLDAVSCCELKPETMRDLKQITYSVKRTHSLGLNGSMRPDLVLTVPPGLITLKVKDVGLVPYLGPLPASLKRIRVDDFKSYRHPVWSRLIIESYNPFSDLVTYAFPSKNASALHRTLPPKHHRCPHVRKSYWKFLSHATGYMDDLHDALLPKRIPQLDIFSWRMTEETSVLNTRMRIVNRKMTLFEWLTNYVCGADSKFMTDFIKPAAKHSYLSKTAHMASILQASVVNPTSNLWETNKPPTSWIYCFDIDLADISETWLSINAKLHLSHGDPCC